MRNDIIEYLHKEVYQRCKQPTNKFGMGCYYHIESVAKNAELLAEKYGADKEVVIIASWLHDIAWNIVMKQLNLLGQQFEILLMLIIFMEMLKIYKFSKAHETHHKKLANQHIVCETL